MEKLYYIQYGKIKELEKQGECFYIESDSSVDLSHLDNIKIECKSNCNIKVGNNCYIRCDDYCNIVCKSSCIINCQNHCNIDTGNYCFIKSGSVCKIKCDCRSNIKCLNLCKIICSYECFIECDNFNTILSTMDSVFVDCKNDCLLFDGRVFIQLDFDIQFILITPGFETIIKKLENITFSNLTLDYINDGSTNFIFCGVNINNSKLTNYISSGVNINDSQFTKIIFNIKDDKFNKQLVQAIKEKNMTKILMLQNENNKNLVKFLIAALHTEEI